jgi:dihydropyrimidine dehydrogenase (NADP+)
MAGDKPPALPNLSGNVVVFGAGDVAADCSQAAFRCGADFVSLVFRRGTVDMRMNEDEAEGLKREKVELIGCCSPVTLVVKDGKATEVVCELMKKVPGTEKYVKDGDQMRTITFDHIISAFGSQIGPDIFSPVKINEKTWALDVNLDTMATPVEGVYAGGDCIGNGTIVEAVNDGKHAAWNMHRFIAGKADVKVPEQPTEVPPFMTPVDLVDLSVNVAGLKFPNPFGIASGPSSENCVMIKKAFQAGFGWVVTKTFQPDQDMLENVSPRIVGDADTNTYLNIELNSERKVDYWERELPKVKKDFPRHIVIASIHSKGSLDTWVDLAKKIAATGVDGLQLNISCPNLGEKDAKPFTEVIRETVQAVHKAVQIPIFPKIGHFQGDIVSLAKAAQAGGAAGVSGVNTISGLYNVTADGTFVPQVGFGDGGKTSYGGMSGRAIKPFALSGVAEVTKSVPGFPFLACGGVENALTAFEFIQVGAPVVQICSASMHTGFKMLGSELVPGLQFLLYARSRPDLKQWASFTPPEMITENPKRKRFGPYNKIDETKEIEEVLKAPLPAEPTVIRTYVPAASATSSASTPSAESFHPKVAASEQKTIQSECGSALKKVANFGDLDVTVKVVSEIDIGQCLNCGRCQVACLDAGYACIIFDKTTRIPKVSPMCRGCGLCVAVCPARCIKMVPKPAKK